MKRLHLFEFEDQPWLPGTLRNHATDSLRGFNRDTSTAHVTHVLDLQRSNPRASA